MANLAVESQTRAKSAVIKVRRRPIKRKCGPAALAAPGLASLPCLSLSGPPISLAVVDEQASKATLKASTRPAIIIGSRTATIRRVGLIGRHRRLGVFDDVVLEGRREVLDKAGTRDQNPLFPGQRRTSPYSPCWEYQPSGVPYGLSLPRLALSSPPRRPGHPPICRSAIRGREMNALSADRRCLCLPDSCWQKQTLKKGLGGLAGRPGMSKA